MWLGSAWLNAQYFEADFFNGVGVAAPPVVVPDPYAWFPSDPFTPDRGKRYEEYAKEKRVRTKGPQRVPRAKRIPPVPVLPSAPPLRFPPIPIPAEPPQVRELPAAAVPSRTTPTEETFGAHWSEYARVPFSLEQEQEEEMFVLALALRELGVDEEAVLAIVLEEVRTNNARSP